MELRAEPHGPHVVVVTIDNQPRRNAMPRAMMAELAALWDRLALDGTCRCNRPHRGGRARVQLGRRHER